MNKLKRLLLITFFGGLFPLIAVPGDGGAGQGDGDKGGEGKADNDGDGKADDNKDGKDDDTGGDGENGNEDGKKDEDKLFSQKDIDRIIEKRITRERKSIEKEFNKKREREKMDETERAKAEKAEAEEKAAAQVKQANKKLIRSEVKLYCANLNIIDSDAAYALLDKEDIEVNDDGQVEGVEAALKSLINKKPYLVKAGGTTGAQQTGDDQSTGGKGKKKFNMNEMIRKAAGR